MANSWPTFVTSAIAGAALGHSENIKISTSGLDFLPMLDRLSSIVDPAAGSDMFRVVGEYRSTEFYQLYDAFVGNTVVNAPLLAARHDESTPPQAREMIRHLRLWLPQPRDELADAELPFLGQGFQDPQTCRVPETPEVLRDEVALHRRLRQPERDSPQRMHRL